MEQILRLEAEGFAALEEHFQVLPLERESGRATSAESRRGQKRGLADRMEMLIVHRTARIGRRGPIRSCRSIYEPRGGGGGADMQMRRSANKERSRLYMQTSRMCRPSTGRGSILLRTRPASLYLPSSRAEPSSRDGPTESAMAPRRLVTNQNRRNEVRPPHRRLGPKLPRSNSVKPSKIR